MGLRWVCDHCSAIAAPPILQAYCGEDIDAGLSHNRPSTWIQGEWGNFDRPYVGIYCTPECVSQAFREWAEKVAT